MLSDFTFVALLPVICMGIFLDCLQILTMDFGSRLKEGVFMFGDFGLLLQTG